MNKLYVGLLLGLAVGSTLSSGFQRTAGEAVSRTTRSVLGVVDSIRVGTESIVEAIKTEDPVIGLPVTEEPVRGLVVNLEEKDTHAANRVELVDRRRELVKPKPSQALDVSQIGTRK